MPYLPFCVGNTIIPIDFIDFWPNWPKTKRKSMRNRHRIRAAGAVAALALAVPASASAVPIVDSGEARLDKAGVTFLTDPTGATLPTQEQYTVNTDGYVLSFAETNAVAGGRPAKYTVSRKTSPA